MISSDDEVVCINNLPRFHSQLTKVIDAVIKASKSDQQFSFRGLTKKSDDDNKDITINGDGSDLT